MLRRQHRIVVRKMESETHEIQLSYSPVLSAKSGRILMHFFSLKVIRFITHFWRKGLSLVTLKLILICVKNFFQRSIVYQMILC